jgi:hypothetical protein
VDVSGVTGQKTPLTSISSACDGTRLAKARGIRCTTGTFVQTYWTKVPFVHRQGSSSPRVAVALCLVITLVGGIRPVRGTLCTILLAAAEPHLRSTSRERPGHPLVHTAPARGRPARSDDGRTMPEAIPLHVPDDAV